MAPDNKPEIQDWSWDQWQAYEESRKAHLNTANSNKIPPASKNSLPPQVWGGWGQQRPRVIMPRQLGFLGFPFIPPKPPPTSTGEKIAIEFRRNVTGQGVLGLVGPSGSGGGVVGG